MRRVAPFVFAALAANAAPWWAQPALAHDGAHALAAAPDRAPRTATARSELPAARKVPDVVVVDATGSSTRAATALATDEPLLVNFIYTTCTSICSTQTAMLAQLQRLLQERQRTARFVSFTIDPDNDTPQRLAQFARQFGIERDWQFFSGRFDDLLAVQQAFDVYRGSKANHPPVVFLRSSRRAPWVRIEGYPTPAELFAEVARLPRAR